MIALAWVLFCGTFVASIGQLSNRAPRRVMNERCRPIPMRRSLVVAIGAWFRSFRGRDGDTARDRCVGRSVIVFVMVAPVSLRLALVGAAVGPLRFVLKQRRVERLRTTEIERELAQAIDLFLLALQSGHNMTESVGHVGRWVRGELGQALRRCSDQVAAGRTIGDALELVPGQLDPSVQPLIGALVANDRYGAPIVATLSQLGADSRLTQRRRSELEARRLPVALLFPLVVCVLPAFLALTVVPVVAETISNFDLL